MITENNVIESIKDSVNLADVSPENFESTVEFIYRQYEIVLKAKDKEIEEYRQEIFHLRKMVESLAKEPIVINLENQNSGERCLARLSREILKTSFNNVEDVRLATLSREMLKTSFNEGDKEQIKYSVTQKILDLLTTDADKPKADHKVNRVFIENDGFGNTLVSFGINAESSELVSSPIEGVDSKQKVSSPKKTLVPLSIRVITLDFLKLLFSKAQFFVFNLVRKDS
jgi:hypothetical protein